jgi:hypothetical protein
LTWDNGGEFAERQALIDIALATKRYFAEPYTFWQRGTNESTNGTCQKDAISARTPMKKFKRLKTNSTTASKKIKLRYATASFQSFLQPWCTS